MKNKLITEYTDEELISNEKKIKGMIITMTFLLVVLLTVLIILTIKKGFSPLLIIPFSLFPLLIINFVNLNNLKKEKKRRNLG